MYLLINLYIIYIIDTPKVEQLVPEQWWLEDASFL